MAKKFTPASCVDCKHYRLADRSHTCRRLIHEGPCLITGKMTTLGYALSCHEERYNSGESWCGKTARFFKEKE
jgi:hypothetical protein